MTEQPTRWAGCVVSFSKPAFLNPCVFCTFSPKLRKPIPFLPSSPSVLAASMDHHHLPSVWEFEGLEVAAHPNSETHTGPGGALGSAGRTHGTSRFGDVPCTSQASRDPSPGFSGF